MFITSKKIIVYFNLIDSKEVTVDGAYLSSFRDLSLGNKESRFESAH